VKPYIVVFENDDRPPDSLGFVSCDVSQHDDLTVAWNHAKELCLAGFRAYVAAVIVAPEPLLEIAKRGPK
jgi:hypothetical protein